MVNKQNIASISITSEEDLRLVLEDIGFNIDEEGYLYDEGLRPVVDQGDNLLKFTEVGSILSGSKILVKEGDYSKVSDYVLNYLS